MPREETSTFAPIHHFERQKFCNEKIESIISYSSESLRIINSLEKTYAELRSMQIDVNDSATYMLVGNTKSVRHSTCIWK